ncbi:hypothetical protein HY994_01470 [Candidatus Micrarchaeota archaeon]|nr:hypothetical protein [Candidatus Micrarchaeota archaeon]
MYVDRLDAALVFLVILGVIIAYVLFWLPVPPAGSKLDAPPTSPNVSGASVTVSLEFPSFMTVCLNATQPDSCAGTQAYAASDKSACDAWVAPDACQYYFLSARLEKRAEPVRSSDAFQDCFSIQSTNWRVKCLEEHAVKLNDQTLCQTIEFTPYRDGCLELVNAKK